MERKLWFKAKNYGWGWYPITWQGWSSIAIYIFLSFHIFKNIEKEVLTFDEIAISYLLPQIALTIFLIIFCYGTGEKPSWRWGVESKNESPAHFYGKVAQKVIIVQENRVLLVLHKGETKWQLPGGRLNSNEDPKSGLEREIREELNLSIYNIKPYFTSRFGGEYNMDSHFLVVYTSQFNEREILEINKIELEDAKWFSQSEIESLDIFSDYKKILQKYFNSK